jgi:hypothetical protein
MAWLRHEYTDKLTQELLGVEVIPEDDLREHNSTEQCECIPDLKDHYGTLMLIHNSFDGREENERGH